MPSGDAENSKAVGRKSDSPSDESIEIAEHINRLVRRDLRELSAANDAFLKFLFTVNAGGAAATLGYLGALAGKNQAAIAKFPLLAFTIGLAATGTAYLFSGVEIGLRIEKRFQEFNDALGLPPYEDVTQRVFTRIEGRLKRALERLERMGSPSARKETSKQLVEPVIRWLKWIEDHGFAVATDVAFAAFLAGAFTGVACILLLV